MSEYHKIESVYKRDPETKYKNFLEGDFTRPEFEFLKDNKWVATEKVDGTNIRVYYDSDVTFMGRTDKAQIPPHLYNALENLFPEDKFKEVFHDSQVTLYGEGYGAKIQKGGGNYRNNQSFVLFDVAIGWVYLERENVVDIAEKLGIEVVPIIGSGTLEDLVEFTREGFNSRWGDFEAEGIVARPSTEMFDRLGNRIITKIKCKDFQ